MTQVIISTVSLAKPDTCEHCGRQGLGLGRLCRPAGSNGRPFCHLLVTRYNHPTPCSCFERTYGRPDLIIQSGLGFAGRTPIR